MENIAVIFGGKSVEHEISIMTGLGVLKNISRGYNTIPIYIDKFGSWWTGEKLNDINFLKNINYKKLKHCYLIPNDNCLHIKGIKDKKVKIDCVVNCMHGINGEDGSLSGVFQLSNIPETSSGVLGNSVCMDKSICKHILKYKRIPMAKFFTFDIDEFNTEQSKIISYINAKIGFPCIIKPCNGGSSIGITKVNNVEEFNKAIQVVSQYDTKILVEEFIDNFREINVAVARLNNEIKISSAEEIIGNSFFDYNNKYSKKTQSKRVCPANIDEDISKQLKKYAITAYKTCNCKGIVRIDFFICDNKVLINEINTIPGSFAFYLWKSEGLIFGRLLTQLIEQAKHDFILNTKKIYDYKSNILNEIKDNDFVFTK